MIVGRLFVALGVKGPKKALGAIGDVKQGLKETASMGLGAKAAILGAVYALERMFSRSGQVGTSLTNFNATLGVSAKTLQQYQYAARQVGVSNQAVEGSFRQLQGTITNTLMGKGAPEGLARVAQVVATIGKNMSPMDLTEFSEDPSKLLQRLQEYAQLEQHAGLRNQVLKSFGLGDDMIAALTRGAFTPEIMAQAPSYSDAQIASLDRANIAWSNLGNKIEMAFGRLNALHGEKLIRDISRVTDQVIRLAEALIKVADQFKLFDRIGDIFSGWSSLLSGDISTGTKQVATEQYGSDSMFNQARVLFDAITGTDYSERKAAEREKQERKTEARTQETQLRERGASRDRDIDRPMSPEEIAAFKNRGKSAAPTVVTVPAPGNAAPPPPSPVRLVAPPPAPGNAAAPELKVVPPPQAPAASAVLGPQAAAPASAPTTISTQNNNVTVSQNLNFQHDGKNAQQTGDSVKRAAQAAFRQMPGLAQGS